MGHEGVELALQGEMALGLMLGLVVLKILATSVTLGAGGSGRYLRPCPLRRGHGRRSAFGKVANQFFPTLTAPPGAYALVGMAALFAAAAHAPITGIIILFEMTDNYRIILPLMFAVVVAHLMASAIYHDSIYSIKLRRKGALAAPQTGDGGPGSSSGDRRHVPGVRDRLPRSFPGGHGRSGPGGKVRSWLVMDAEEELLGIVTETDLEAAIVSGRAGEADGPGHHDHGPDHLHPAENPSGPPSAGSLTGPSIRFRWWRRRIPGKWRESYGRNELLWAFKELADEHQRLLHRDRGGGDSQARRVGPDGGPG